MKTSAKILLTVFFGLSAQAEMAHSDEGLPVNIVCKDPKMSAAVITLGLDIKNNRANLVYRNSDVGDPVNILVHDVAGIYSSSFASLSNTSTGSQLGEKTLVVEASFREVLRTTRFANFTLVLTNDLDGGKIKLTRLTYDQGIEEIDGVYPQSVNFRNSQVTCEISGL